MRSKTKKIDEFSIVFLAQKVRKTAGFSSEKLQILKKNYIFLGGGFYTPIVVLKMGHPRVGNRHTKMILPPPPHHQVYHPHFNNSICL